MPVSVRLNHRPGGWRRRRDDLPSRWTTSRSTEGTVGSYSDASVTPLAAPDAPYELSSDCGSRDQARRCSSDRFQGNNASGWAGA